jgi:hypothetical protein
VGQPATAKFWQLDQLMLDEGIIRHSSSRWSSLLHMVLKLPPVKLADSGGQIFSAEYSRSGRTPGRLQAAQQTGPLLKFKRQSL